MKKFLLLPTLISHILIACANNSVQGNDNFDQVEKGFAKGRVVDTQGKPIAGAKVYVDNTIYFNSGISTTTNADGFYKVQVPPGSWRVYAEITIQYNGRKFKKLDLHPDNADSFAGTDGVVRNFQWKLTGEKPEPLVGFYGGLVNLFNNPNGNMYDVENIEFTFTPAGPLIDGSEGLVIKAKCGAPRSESYSKINDIPMGKYVVTAKYLPSGKQLKLSDYNGQDNYVPSLTIEFEPELNYCNRCMAIAYSDL
ncbi:MAG TPA: carboxypeptidase-like regulatory domain-containing protein [Chitinophagaceae bacterium]|nr:carboxypeptidase-like regulatory domain-containing protein [Chitinophagaceae bacterium]